MKRSALYLILLFPLFHVEHFSQTVSPESFMRRFFLKAKPDGCRIDSIYYDFPWGYYAEGEDQGACL